MVHKAGKAAASRGLRPRPLAVASATVAAACARRVVMAAGWPTLAAVIAHRGTAIAAGEAVVAMVAGNGVAKNRRRESNMTGYLEGLQ
ncbi:exported hypothetical protein [Candidatus Defluviicoccus seviourii]|uniref:Uncharacterized protein n=1 Tax=Candidatus Defluviicoccus seviourii TaxID=2565273 RepID=A0A564WGP9_9PROT|nr:exported hypothetical protein [Candidatus Defluviicoccus seviourii]